MGLPLSQSLHTHSGPVPVPSSVSGLLVVHINYTFLSVCSVIFEWGSSLVVGRGRDSKRKGVDFCHFLFISLFKKSCWLSLFLFLFLGSQLKFQGPFSNPNPEVMSSVWRVTAGYLTAPRVGPARRGSLDRSGMGGAPDKVHSCLQASFGASFPPSGCLVLPRVSRGHYSFTGSVPSLQKHTYILKELGGGGGGHSCIACQRCELLDTAPWHVLFTTGAS